MREGRGQEGEGGRIRPPGEGRPSGERRPQAGSAITRREALRITATAAMAVGLGAGLLDLLRAGRLRRVERTALRLGSPVTIAAVHPEGEVARGWVDAAFSEMERLEAILSRHREDTPLSHLNRKGALPAAPPELLLVIREALALARASGGAFDPTVGPLLALHRRRFRETGAPPSAGEVEAALARVGHRHLRLEGTRVILSHPGMSVTLDGIAKGYIVDATVAHLGHLGAERVLVNAGGDLASRGAPMPGGAWRVGIRDPLDQGAVAGAVELSGSRGMATSGDYVHAFTPDRRHHHIVDPRTGWSPGDVRSVTVLAPGCFEADALATAAFVLGPREGIAFLAERDGAEGLVVDREGRRHATPGFPRRLG